MTEEAENVKPAKINRRAAKAALTRCGRALAHLVEHKRSASEVRDSLIKVNNAYENLVTKHELYTNLLTDDEEFNKEESWLEESQSYYLKLDIDTKGYIESISLPAEASNKSELGESSASGMIGMQSAKDANLSNTSQNESVDINDMSQETTTDASNNATVNSAPENVIITPQPNETNHGQNVENVENKTEIGTVYDSRSCGFQMEKPKLPKFSGDVREYAIFRADFKHAIETRYSKRDSITLLCTCLKEKPLELIKGIGRIMTRRCQVCIGYNYTGHC